MFMKFSTIAQVKHSATEDREDEVTRLSLKSNETGFSFPFSIFFTRLVSFWRKDIHFPIKTVRNVAARTSSKLFAPCFGAKSTTTEIDLPLAPPLPEDQLRQVLRG